jgi:hypothetical protein
VEGSHASARRVVAAVDRVRREAQQGGARQGTAGDDPIAQLVRKRLSAGEELVGPGRHGRHCGDEDSGLGSNGASLCFIASLLRDP